MLFHLVNHSFQQFVLSETADYKRTQNVTYLSLNIRRIKTQCYDLLFVGVFFFFSKKYQHYLIMFVHSTDSTSIC